MTRRPARDMTERTGLIFFDKRRTLLVKLLNPRDNAGRIARRQMPRHGRLLQLKFQIFKTYDRRGAVLAI